MSIVLEGLPDLIDELEGFEKASKAALMKAMDESCQRVERDAKNLVHVISGELRGSIEYEVTETSDGVEGKVSAKKDYAVYEEFGTGTLGAADHEGTDPNANPTYTVTGKKSGKPFLGRPAHPYLYPAYKANRKAIQQTFADAIKNAAGGD